METRFLGVNGLKGEVENMETTPFTTHRVLDDLVHRITGGLNSVNPWNNQARN